MGPEVATAASCFSAIVASTSQALRWNTPCPAMINGRSALLIMSAAFCTSFGEGKARDSVRYFSLL
jgi:hypothetical protein